jgi:hypothetical protein
LTNNNNHVASGIYDNFLRGNIGDFLRRKIIDGADLSIVSAYFTIYAYEALKDKLDSINSLRFLFGEPKFIKTIDPEKNESKVYSLEENHIQLSNQLNQKRTAKDCADWIENKVEIRSITKTNFLHGKMYHINNENINDAILGSSNFTVHGLGLGENQNNVELNYEINDKRDRKDLLEWFNTLWNDKKLTEDVKAEVLKYLEKLYKDNSPEFIYYKTLFHIFEDYLKEQEALDFKEKDQLIVDSGIWNALFDFQKDGVKGAINKLTNYGGCIIADSVGLGKTYEALAIIKYYELQNYRVLVLCPKKLKENWTVYQANIGSELNPFPEDRFNYTVLSHTDLSRDSGYAGDINLENFSWGTYDLVVIDESHNFRNNTKGRRDEDGNLVSMSRYERLMQNIIKGKVKTRVLMLSATPVNTSLKDLRNQIHFITEENDNAFYSTLGIPSLNNLINRSQRVFTTWAEERDKHKTDDLLNKLSPAFFRLLDGLTIARSRKHVVKYYKDTVKRLGGFPHRAKPISIFSEIDLNNEFPSYDRLNDLISDYQLSLFKPSTYILPDRVKAYEFDNMPNFNQAQRENFLIGMMKVGFLKRLESSINSFTISIGRTIEKIDSLLKTITEFEALSEKAGDIDFDDLEIDSEADEELIDALDNMKVGKKLEIKLVDLDLEKWKQDLKSDREKMQEIYNIARCVTVERDAKLKELKKIISDKVAHPTQNLNGKPCKKILLFTAFADTAKYLYENLTHWAQDELGIHSALVTGGGSNDKTTLGKSDYNHILTNFAPIAKNRARISSMEQDQEIDLLIATDCISEGQNLQDCDLVVNFDIHWNPVRIIQRFGRIDRIGSLHSSVNMVNFWPTKDLDKYISLRNRVEARMALVDVSAAADDNPLEVDGIQELIEDELTYRDKQLLRLRDEVMDLEDFNETVDLTDFSLEDFRADLSRYIESNRKLLEESPLGLNCLVAPDKDTAAVRPGVIFCLRQLNSSPELLEINPVHPYYLVYVFADGNVRFSFPHSKQILEMMRALCSGKHEALSALCESFELETENGSNMQHYDGLLNASVKFILNRIKRLMIGGLVIDKNSVIPPLEDQPKTNDDFELITWVVIKDE